MTRRASRIPCANPVVAVCLAAALVVGACETTGPQRSSTASRGAAASPNGNDNYGALVVPIWVRPLCTIGSILALDKVLDDLLRKYAARMRLHPAQAKRLKAGLGVMLGVAGCATLESYTNSVFAKMSQNDLRERDRVLQEAATTNTPRSHRTASGVDERAAPIPGSEFRNDDGENCKVIEDTAVVSGQRSEIAVTMCMNTTTQRWEQRLVA